MAVPNTLKVFADLQKLALDITALVKDGKISILDLPQFLGLFSDLTTLASDLPACLTELKTLSAEDFGTLATAGYGVVDAELASLGIVLPTPSVA